MKIFIYNKHIIRKLLQLTLNSKACWNKKGLLDFSSPHLTYCDTSAAEDSAGKLVDLLTWEYPFQ